MGAVWGDYDNDGWEDLFVFKYGYPQLLRNVEGRLFQDVTEGMGLRRRMNSNGAVWIDYGRDGLLDLYVAGHFREETDRWNLESTRIFHDSFEFARNGGVNRLFRNTGDGFLDVTTEMGVGSTRWTLAVAEGPAAGSSRTLSTGPKSARPACPATSGPGCSCATPRAASLTWLNGRGSATPTTGGPLCSPTGASRT